MADSSDFAANQGFYLRPDVKCEPLIGRWLAFHHLLAPVQFSMNLANRIVPLLESYLAAPAIHAAASKDPSLYGGAFVDLPASAAPTVRNLLGELKQKASASLHFASRIRALAAEFSASANGENLNSCYEIIPEKLKGAVEFSYDLSNRSVMRLREELLYGSEIGSTSLQAVMLQQVGDRERRFFLNTPRLDNQMTSLYIPLPFTNPAVGDLFRARTEAVHLDVLAAALGKTQAELRPFFTSSAPLRVAPRHQGAGIRIRYFGHACVLLETAEVTILMDPTFAHERDEELARLTFLDLPDHIDFVLISHAHADHFSVEDLLHLRDRVGCVVVPRNNAGSIADPSMKLALKALGFQDVRVVEDFDVIEVPGGRITALPFPGEHNDLDILSKQAFSVVLEQRQFVFLVDSDAIDAALYHRMAERLGPVDAIFIGMECQGCPLTFLYGPLLLTSISRGADQSRRGNGSDSARAWEVIQALRPREAFIYAMGLEPWNRHLLGLENAPDSIQMRESDAFIRMCHQAGMPAERLKGCVEMYFEAAASGGSSRGGSTKMEHQALASGTGVRSV